MLELADSRWSGLTCFFGEAADIPKAIERWLDSLGSDPERDAYFDGLRELFLHQLTITNAAFAVVPWLLHACAQSGPCLRWLYMTDIAVVEANRLEHGVYFNREGTPEYPGWLMPEYHVAIARARDVATELIQLDRAAAARVGLLAMYPALGGDSKLAWQQWTQRAE